MKLLSHLLGNVFHVFHVFHLFSLLLKINAQKFSCNLSLDCEDVFCLEGVRSVVWKIF